MSQPTARRATYQDLLAVPGHLVAEILDGELVTSPRPASPHARAASVLGSDLIGSFDWPAGGSGRPGGWWLLFEPELQLGDDTVVPDLAGWRRERLPVLPNVAQFALAPDWACEVVSAGTEAIDRGPKRRIYAHAGVSHLWLLTPQARALEVFRRSGELWTLVGTFVGSEPIRAEPFDAVELVPSRWWLESTPPEDMTVAPSRRSWPGRQVPCPRFLLGGREQLVALTPALLGPQGVSAQDQPRRSARCWVSRGRPVLNSRRSEQRSEPRRRPGAGHGRARQGPGAHPAEPRPALARNARVQG